MSWPHSQWKRIEHRARSPLRVSATGSEYTFNLWNNDGSIVRRIAHAAPSGEFESWVAHHLLKYFAGCADELLLHEEP